MCIDGDAHKICTSRESREYDSGPFSGEAGHTESSADLTQIVSLVIKQEMCAKSQIDTSTFSHSDGVS